MTPVRNSRHAFTVVEVMMALAILSLFLFPTLALQRPRDSALEPKHSAAAYLLRDTIDRFTSMPREKLYKLVGEGREYGNGYVELEVTNPMAAKLGARLFVRVNKNFGGRFGLDRLDFTLAYEGQKGTRFITRPIIKRNEQELLALSKLRLFQDIERFSDEELRGEIKKVVRDAKSVSIAFSDPSSPFAIPEYPELLQTFEPVRIDMKWYEEAQKAWEPYGKAPSIAFGDFISSEEPPRPRFEPGSAVCD